jgi:hypothetical protein
VTTSGSTDFTVTRDELIGDALSILGVLGVGETPSADDVNLASRRLNAMVKAWQAAGTHLWTKTEGSISLVANSQSYTMGPAGDFSVRPLKILSARRTVSSIDTPLTAWSRSDYFDQPNKATASYPTNFYYDPQLGTGRLYVWPVLATGNTATLAFTYARQLEDFDAAANTSDLPQEWIEALTYNLAIRLQGPFGQAMSDDDRAIAVASLDLARGFDVEPASVFIGADLGVG